MASRKGTVNSQMPSGKVSLTGAAGTYDRNKAPFDHPHDLGGGGVPLKFFADMGESLASRITPTQTAPSAQGQVRKGTRQFKYGSNS